MPKESLFQARMDTDIKEQVEKIYENLGTSFTEAVRVFAKASIMAKGYPFIIQQDALQKNSNPDSFQTLLSFAGSISREIDEKKELAEARSEKYENTD